MQPQAFRSRSFYVSADIDPFKFPSVAGARGSDWPDIQYMQHSILDAWPEDLHETFDLVHQRLVMAASGSVPFVETLMRFKSILRPGGWLQLVEWDTSPSPEQVGSAMEDHKDLVRAVGARTGVPPNFAAKLKDDLGEAGFVDVKEDHFTVLHGKRILERGGPTDIAELSIESPVMFNRRFCSIAKKSGAEIEDQKLERLSERLEEELRNVGGSILVRVVCGCRP